AGKRVGVSTTSHKAIHNLVREVEKVAHAQGVALRGMHKHGMGADSRYESKHELVGTTDDNAALTDPDLNLVSGTPWLFSRAHDGRRQYAPEEAVVIAAACRDLLAGGKTTLREDGTRDLLAEDIMVVAPYNLAVREIETAVPAAVRVGTVDRFQGQEAPVVFY